MVEIIKLSCPFCGGKLDIPLHSNKVTCTYCGQDSVITGTQGLINHQSNCPICGDKDQVQKVSGIMLSDSPVSQHLRPPDKPTVLSFEEFSSRQPAAPPPARDFKKSPKWFPLTMSILFGICVLFFIIGFIAEPNYAEDNTLRYLMFAGFVVIFGICVAATSNIVRNNRACTAKELRFQESLRAYEVEQKGREGQLRSEYDAYGQKSLGEWQKAMQRWELLYYCRRDNIVFIPGASHYFPASEYMRYLTSEEL